MASGCAGGNGLQALGNVAQGFVPGHGRELAAAFGAAALEGGEDALGVVGALGVLAHLGAQHTIGLGVVGVALHPGGHAVFYGSKQSAGVGAVVRAGAANAVKLSWSRVRQ